MMRTPHQAVIAIALPVAVLAGLVQSNSQAAAPRHALSTQTTHHHYHHTDFSLRLRVSHHPSPKARHSGSRLYRMYDSAQVQGIPGNQAAAVYATGSYTASLRQTKRLGHVMWIDVTGTDYEASVLDSEPGNPTPAQAASWAARRLRLYPHSIARIYMMKSWWHAVVMNVRARVSRGQRSRVHYWVADPTGSPHILKGSDATQWGWSKSYDVSTARSGF